jgi:hypothetical protein
MAEADGKATMPDEAVGASDRLARKRWLYGDEPHLQRAHWSNPTYRCRHGSWLLRSTSDTREHRRELRKGRIDRGLLRPGSAQTQRYVDTDTLLHRIVGLRRVAALCPVTDIGLQDESEERICAVPGLPMRVRVR